MLSTIRFFAFVGAFALLISCKGYAPQIIHATEDCITQERPAIEALLKKWADAHFSFAQIESDALSSGFHIGMCAAKEYVNIFLTPAPGVRAPDPDQTWAATAMLSDLQVKFKIGDVTFKTPKGNL